jgi:hypothetical protein
MERYFAQLRGPKPSAALGPRSYVAIVDEIPSLDLGIKRHRCKEQLNLLLGFY